MKMTPVVTKITQDIAVHQKSAVRFLISMGTGLVALFGVLLVVGVYVRSGMIDLRKDELARLVTVGYNTIEPIIDAYQKGELSRSSALEKVTDAVRRMTYTDPTQDNYLFMSSYRGLMLVQPFEPGREGTSQWDLVDFRGKYIIRSLVERAKEGSGYVTYYYPPPDSQEPEPKISYVRGIDPLDCYIGTGMYIGDINSLVRSTILPVSLLIIAVFLGLLGVTFGLISPFIRTYRYLLFVFDSITRDPARGFSAPSRENIRNPEALGLIMNFEAMMWKLEDERKNLEARERQLAASLSEKEILLKEVHHRVKNNLQIIISLLNLQAGTADGGCSRDVIQESVNRVQAMSRIHESLYRDEIFSVPQLDRYINELTSYLIQVYRKQDITLSVNRSVSFTRLDLDQAVLTGLIINELVSNAVKHAFEGRGEGTISVTLEQADGLITLVVRDDGIGLSRGSEGPGDTLGLKLVGALTQQLGGSFTFHEEGGTECTVRFPASAE
ncbi:MAG: cache domain-containing protein [Spirochaetia bacterium]